MRNCHYNHEHKADPSVVDDIFGPVGAAWTGQSISYPWQTFSLAHVDNIGDNYPAPPPDPTMTENDRKHEGYAWYVIRGEQPPYDYRLDCKPEGSSTRDTCIVAARIQLHAVGASVGAITRFHSYWMEALACEQSGERCGVIRTGGWVDFGVLSIPYQGEVILLPGDPPEFANRNTKTGPYRAHFAPDDPGSPSILWNGPIFDFRVRDAFGGTYPETPSQLHLACPDFQCELNASTLKVFRVEFKVGRDLDDDGDGFVTMAGYTDRYGNLVDGCTSPGLDCVSIYVRRCTSRVRSIRCGSSWARVAV